MSSADEQMQQHRDAIDALDGDILRLINQRAQHAQAIGHLKGQGVVYRPEREAQVLRRIKEINPGPLSDEAAARLFREVMSACLALERPLTIAYLGPAGTFSEAAAVKHFGHAAQLLPQPSISDVFRAVESGAADYAVVPVENSTEGGVNPTLDLMVQTPLKICGEVVLRIHHHLLRARPGRDGALRLLTHAQTLGQCHEWLNRHLPEVERVAVSSNSEAARLASEDEQLLAIAGDAAAERYGLCKLTENIEDEPNNTTRFVVLGKQDSGPSGKDKTSLILSTPNQPGAVHGLLQPFAEHGVSMTKFESRPAKTGLWEYVFFIDVDGHQQDAALAQALTTLRTSAGFVKILGSYPVAVL